MARTIKTSVSSGDRVVAIVGQGHTFRRDPKDVRHDASIAHLGFQEKLAGWNRSVSTSTKARLLKRAQAYTFESTAEKLHRMGIGAYTIGEIDPLLDRLSPGHADGLLNRTEARALNSWGIDYVMGTHGNGKSSAAAPELIYQRHKVKLDSWDAIFVPPFDLNGSFSEISHFF